ncbi:MAG: serine hydrolase domain-containing protein [Bacteroidota bacterium]
MKYTVGIILILSIVFQSCTKSVDAVDSYFGFDIPKDSLQSYLQNKMESLNIPGMSFAMINEGEVVYHETFGYANVAEKIPVSDKTIFEAASLSKPVFAFFVMKYVEEGKLDLDKPLYEYLPYPDIAHDERYKKITARMVLSHRTGFPNWRGDTPENKLHIKFEPGTDYFYSGEGYQYLAKVLKHIEDTDWEGLEQQFQEKIAAPFGMEHTVFIQDAYSIANKAEPYDDDGKWINPERDRDSIVRYQFVAPASLHSEAIDFSKWMIAVMNHEGLQQQSYAELFKVHSYVGEFNSFKVNYSLGFFVPEVPFANIFLHGGNNFGFTCYFALDPEDKWGYVLFTNSEYGEQLGSEFALYAMFGPNMAKVYSILAVFALGIILMIVFVIRRIRKRIRNRKNA